MVDASLFAACFMDHLINFMNNDCSSFLPLFHFPLITNPVTSHIHFFTPCSEIDYSQEIVLVSRQLKVAVSCVDYSDVLLV
jgi:hypothetical protein